MAAYIAKRLLAAIPVLFGLTLIVFLIMAMIPGDPATAILGNFATPENVARLNAQLGLDEPLPQRYLIWLGNLLQGDLGRSFALNRPVLDEVLERFPGDPHPRRRRAFLLCSDLRPAGRHRLRRAPVRLGRPRSSPCIVLIGISTPSFFLGLLLILVVRSSTCKWFPAERHVRDLRRRRPAGPALPPRHARRDAGGGRHRRHRAPHPHRHARGPAPRLHPHRPRQGAAASARVIYRHAFKAALVSVIPVIGIQAGFVLGGAVYIETVFQWPGIGAMLVNAISTRDILLVQGGVLVVAASYVLFNLVADVMQSILDPRLRT
jgi:peptide/nickel transport system permease protein